MSHPITPAQALGELERPVAVWRDTNGALCLSHEPNPARPLVAWLPPLPPAALGDPRFRLRHDRGLAYVVGEMAHGISDERVVAAAAAAGALGFFGAAGLDLGRIERALLALRDTTFGVNVIHQPADPGAEDALVDLLIRHHVARVSASAFMGLTPALVRLAFAGARSLPDGRVQRRHLFAKVSRPEVARAFLAPAPDVIVTALVAHGALTTDEAALARRLPVADHLTVEADSAGHTDARPLAVLFPAIAALRDELARSHGFEPPLLGAAGGLGTPTAIAAAFALGAAYVLTGSINQAAREAATSDAVKTMLASADLADVALAPAADMFELGAKVQVLKRGTMFAQRATRLGEIYRTYASLAAIPEDVRARLERELFRQPLDAVSAEVERFFAQRDPERLASAARDPKAMLALVFRWYLGLSSRWAEAGEPNRVIDYQIWCGPAMGAFNRWAAGTPLADPAARTIGAITSALMRAAAQVTRAHQLRLAGLTVAAADHLATPSAT